MFSRQHINFLLYKVFSVAAENLKRASGNAFYESKIHTLQFFYKCELPKINYLPQCLQNDEILTIFEEEQEMIL